MQFKILFISLISSFQLLAQQSNIKGEVSIFNSATETGRRKFVMNAQVEDYFKKAQPTVTNAFGIFQLIFVGISANENVSFIIKKKGLEVVNIDALKGVTGQNNIIKISMAAPDSLIEYRRKIYFIGKTETEKYQQKKLSDKNRELISLKKDSLYNKKKIDSLNNQIVELEKNNKDFEAQLQDLATRYSTVNLDDAKPIFRNAFLLFQKGNLDSSLKLLSQIDLPKRVDLLLDEEKSNNLSRVLIKRDKQDCGEVLLLKANFHSLRFEYDSAIKCYESLVKLDSSNISYIFDYSFFMRSLKHYREAILLNLKALDLCKISPANSLPDLSLKALILNELGVNYWNLNNFKQAETSYLFSLKIFQILLEHSKNFIVNVGDLYNNLGNLYSKKRELLLAEQYYAKALKIRDSLAIVLPLFYEEYKAQTMENLGILYREKHENLLSEDLFLKSLQIERKYAQSNNLKAKQNLGFTLINLGTLYNDKGEFKISETYLLEALSIFKTFSKLNFRVYVSNIALTLFNLGNTYVKMEDTIRASSTVLECIDLNRELFRIDSQAYQIDFARALNLQGIFYTSIKKYQAAEEAFLFAIKLFQDTIYQNQEFYLADLGRVKSNLGNLYFDQKIYDGAEKFYHETLVIFENLVTQNPNYYEEELASIQNALGSLYLDQKKYSQSESFLRVALENRLKLGNKLESTSYSISSSFNNLGNLYKNMLKYDSSEKMLLNALEIFEDLFKIDSIKYKNDLAGVMYNLGSLYSETNKLKRSYFFLDSALTIYSSLSNKIYAYNIAKAKTIIGNNFRNNNEFSKALSAYSDAIKIWKAQDVNESFQRESDLAITLNSLAILYAKNKKLADAIKTFEELLPIRRKLAKLNPEIYKGDLATCLSNMCGAYLDQNKLDSGELVGSEARLIFQQLPELDSHFLTIFGNVNANLGQILYLEKKYPQAELLLKDAIDIQIKLSDYYSETYKTNIGHTYNMLGLVLQNEKKFSLSESAFSNALKIYETLEAGNPLNFLEEIQLIKNHLSSLHLRKEDN